MADPSAIPPGQRIDNTNIPLNQDFINAGIVPPPPFQQPTVGVGPQVQLPQGSNLTGLMMNPFGFTPPKGLGKYGGSAEVWASAVNRSVIRNWSPLKLATAERRGKARMAFNEREATHWRGKAKE